MKSIMYLVFILTLLLSFKSIACEGPYLLKVGAFFNTTSLVTFWSDFTQQLTIKTKCPVNIKPSSTFKSYVIDLINKTGDIFLIPSHYAYTLQKYGYIPVLKVVSRTKMHLITQKQYDPNDLTTLAKKNISVPSKYSAGYAIIKLEFEKLGLLDTVNFVYGDTLQSNSIKVLRGESDATVIFSPVFDLLPQPIKDRINTSTLLEDPVAGYIMVKPGTPQKLIDAIQTSHEHISILEWSPTNSIEKRSSISYVFEEQFLALLNEAKLKDLP